MSHYKVKSLIDLSVIYLTSAEGIAPRLTNEEINQRLRRLPLVQTLYVLAQLAYRAETITMFDDKGKIAFVNDVFRPSVAKRARRKLRIDRRYHVMSSQIVCALALRAVLYCDRNLPDRDGKWITRDIGDLVLALGGILNETPIEYDDMILELTRLDLWSRVNEYDWWYETAHRIIFDFLPLLNSDTDWIDSRLLLESSTGIKHDLYWGITTAMAIHSHTDPNAFLFPHYIDKAQVPNGIIDKWMAFWTREMDDAGTFAQQDIDDERMWSFSAFYDKPILNIGNGKGLVIRPWFMASKATPLGYYNAVEQLLAGKINEPQRIKWSHLFGKAVELMGRTLLDEYVPLLNRLHDEDAIRKAWWMGVKNLPKTCDTVILGQEWIAIDFVFRRVNKNAATTGDINDLAKDLNSGVVEKLEQIDSTIALGVAKEGMPKGGVYPLVVVGAPFPCHAAALNWIDKETDKRGLKFIGKHPQCKKPMIMELYEYWLWLELANEMSVHPATLLAAWMQSPLDRTNFRNWASTMKLKTKPAQASRRHYATHSLRQLFPKSAN